MKYKLFHTLTEVDLSETPEAMRHIVDKKQLVKLTRHADQVFVFVPDLDLWVKPQKTHFISQIGNAFADAEYLATFNGLDLQVYGEVGGEDEGDNNE